MLIRELLERGRQALGDSSPSARLDAEVLLMHLLECDRAGVIVRGGEPCLESTVAEYERLLVRRQHGEPVAYITGEREFWGMTFAVTPDVLIPRPESELLVEEGAAILAGVTAPRFVDLGTGSGALVIALVSELRRRGVADVRGVAVDLSEAALRVAEANAERLGVRDAVTFLRSDWFAEREVFSPPYDLVVANPPYVSHAEVMPVDLTFEPSSALFADDDGLKDCKEIVRQSQDMLKPGGVLLCEVGAGKRRLLKEWFEQGVVSGAQVAYLGDDSESDRFTVIRVGWPVGSDRL